MYRTKKDVDRHVQDINNKIKSAQERNLKGYFIAKLYYQVGDYESARKYLAGYLAERDSQSMAHKLNGQILTALKQTEKAVSAYKTCYQLDTSQKDVLQTICELLVELPIDPGRTQYWIEQAEKSLPQSEILFRLKEALIGKTAGETSAEFEQMIIQELVEKPQDVNLRMRLIRYYQRVGRIKEGYEHGIKVEEKRPWPSNLAWYKTMLEIAENYQVAYKGNVGKDFYGEYLSILDSSVTLETKEGSQYTRIAELVSRMDKILLEASQSQVPTQKGILEHFQSQFYLHSARLIFRKLTKDIHPGSIKENHRTLGCALLAAFSQKPAKEVQSPRWAHLVQDEVVRRSIAGHCILSLAARFGGLENYRERLASSSGINSKISGLIFVSLERRIHTDTENSFLLSSQFPVDILTAEFPSAGSLKELDIVAAQACLSDLNSLIWILLRYYTTGKVLDIGFPLPTIDGLTEIPSPPYYGISLLDAHCFLYAAAYTAGYQEEKNEELLVPPYLGANLTSVDQDGWWKHVLSSGRGNLAPQDKRSLQYGLDAIRCKGLHGLDVQLTLKLGKTYECHALEAAATADQDSHANSMVPVLESRAATYYKAALASIEKIEAGVGIREPILRLFSAAGAEPGKSELGKMRESAKFFLACENMHLGMHEEALARFREVKSAFSSFYSAEIYKKLAIEEKLANPTRFGVSQTYLNYLTDAREALYLTLDRLKAEPSGHALNCSIGDAVEEVENMLNSCDAVEELPNGTSDQTDSTMNRMEQLSSTPRSRIRATEQLGTPGLRTPNRSLFLEEREAKPSPERLDAQIRQLTHSQDGIVRQISNRDHELLENSREMLACFKDFRTEIQEVRIIKSEIQELRKELKARDEKTHDLLQKIVDKPDHICNTEPSTNLSEEEKLLLESFGIGSQTTASASAAAAAFHPLINLQQQQLMMAMAAAQQPLTPRPMGVRPGLPMPGMSPSPFNQGMLGLYGSPLNMYGVQLPTIPAPNSSEISVLQNHPSVNNKVLPSHVTTPTHPSVITPVQNRPLETGPPTNVVISKSDLIPTVAPPAVSFSVTVPAQHRFGVVPQPPTTPQQNRLQPSTPQSAYKTPGTGPSTPHGFQISLPTFSPAVPVSPFKDGDAPAVPLTTQSLLSSVPSPAYSAVTPSPDKGIVTSSSKSRMSSGGTPKAREPSIGEEPEEYEPEVDFKPVVPLPEEIEVITGEEDEDILFEDRAKLFRFSDDSKEWKERGLGQAKILRNKETGQVRFLMRRDQTFKICANHTILPEIKLDLMKGNTKARIWGAQDFSDGEITTEKFCIKMKTEEQIEKFHAVFVEAAKTAVSSSPRKPEKAVEKASTGKSLADFAAAQKSGSWECEGCLTRNDNTKIQCLACEGAKPGCEEEVKKLKEAAKPAAAVMTIGAGGGFKFGGSSTTSEPRSSGFSFGSPAGTAETSQNGGISFGTPKLTTSDTVSFGTPKITEIGFGTLKTNGASLGGFSFSTTPTVAKPEEKKVEAITSAEVSKPSPFSGFSFNAGSKIEQVKPDEKKEIEKPVLGANTFVSFESLGKQSTEGIASDSNFKGFSTAGSKLFTPQKAEEDGEVGDAEDYEPDVQFQPVIPLPELVEVKTGEEDEDILFSERSKLFRYVPESKEWKERGIGEFKILKNRASGKIRFLMRREQVHKICCNHNLTVDIEIKPMATSDKAWTWTAPDFSEGEIKNEVFGLKFKNADIAGTFKTVVDDCQKELKNKPAVSSSTVPQTTDSTKSSKGRSLADFAAAQKSGSWECEGCLTRNDNSKIQCLACEGAKPGCEEEVKKLKEAAKPAAAVMTIGAGGGFKFGGGGAPASSGSGFVFGGGSSTATSTPGFSFGTPKSTAQVSKEDSPKPPFGTKDTHEFSFGGIRTSPRKHNESTTSENDLYQEDEGDNIYFEPVIPLPEKVDVKTGEEEETVLYSHKAKVFRFTDGEWKERGIGDIKILKHEKTGKVRLLMRREQVLKICLNHYVTPQLVSNFKEKDTKSWTWAAQDFSDGELTSMTFALRFKTPDISSDFKSVLDTAMSSFEAVTPSESKPTESIIKPTVSEPASKPSPSVSEDENLFPLKDFKPLKHIERENELSFDGLGLKLNTEEDAKDVAEKIRVEKNMNTLTLSGNTVGIEAAKAIGKALESQPEFRRAHWKDMFTGRMKTEIPPALINLTRGIMTAHGQLVELDLSDNAFGPIGMEGLTTFMTSPSCFTLQELRLNNTGCGVTGGKLLAKTLLECYHRGKSVGHPLALKVFVLGRSRQENEGAKALSEVFKLMGSLEEVVMPQNGIYHEGLTALADALSCNPNLRILNLNDNTFTDKGAKAFSKTLKKLNNLEVLNLGDCLLKSAGAKLISRALKNRHPNLTELVLDSNEIRISGGLEIIDAVAGKDKLEKLSIDGNWFGEAGAELLSKKIKTLGKSHILGSLEDNEEPDEDEPDPELEDEDEVEPKTVSPPKPIGSIFSGSSTPTIFGESSSVAQNLFGGSSKPLGSSIFGSPAPTTTAGSSIFGGSTPSNVEKPSLFGGGIKPSSGLFGATSQPSSGLFGSPAAAGSTLFGKPITNSAFSFSSPSSVKSETKPDSTLETGKLFNSDPSFSFASLASAGENSGFGFGEKNEGFKFEGSGAKLFGKVDTSRNDDDEDEEDEDGDGHDPHFEPIVPLPELVSVTTGEEEEEVLFKHRAKVYRFDSDTKEWKERGVGDIKILKHPVRGSFRILLRRDQVYKIACNHLINKDMELKPLASSETAWCWFAMDYGEGCEGGSLDQLAVRFKTKDTAVEFKSKFEECQSEIKSGPTPVGKESSKDRTETSSTGTEETQKYQTEDGDEDESYYDDEDDEGDNTPMFEAEAELMIREEGKSWTSPTQVILRIMYDEDVFGARIIGRDVEAEDDQPDLCDHVIAMQNILEDDLSWTALDYASEDPVRKTFRVSFNSRDIINDFRDTFAQGKEFAEQCEILETGPGEELDPSQAYYGVGGD